MIKTILIYEIGTDRSLTEYQINLTDETSELKSFELAWEKAINEGLVEEKDRHKYALQTLTPPE